MNSLPPWGGPAIQKDARPSSARQKVSVVNNNTVAQLNCEKKPLVQQYSHETVLSKEKEEEQALPGLRQELKTALGEWVSELSSGLPAFSLRKGEEVSAPLPELTETHQEIPASEVCRLEAMLKASSRAAFATNATLDAEFVQSHIRSAMQRLEQSREDYIRQSYEQYEKMMQQRLLADLLDTSKRTASAIIIQRAFRKWSKDLQSARKHNETLLDDKGIPSQESALVEAKLGCPQPRQINRSKGEDKTVVSGGVLMPHGEHHKPKAKARYMESTGRIKDNSLLLPADPKSAKGQQSHWTKINTSMYAQQRRPSAGTISAVARLLHKCFAARDAGLDTSEQDAEKIEQDALLQQLGITKIEDLVIARGLLQRLDVAVRAGQPPPEISLGSNKSLRQLGRLVAIGAKAVWEGGTGSRSGSKQISDQKWYGLGSDQIGPGLGLCKWPTIDKSRTGSEIVSRASVFDMEVLLQSASDLELLMEGEALEKYCLQLLVNLDADMPLDQPLESLSFYDDALIFYEECMASREKKYSLIFDDIDSASFKESQIPSGREGSQTQGVPISTQSDSSYNPDSISDFQSNPFQLSGNHIKKTQGRPSSGNLIETLGPPPGSPSSPRFNYRWSSPGIRSSSPGACPSSSSSLPRSEVAFQTSSSSANARNIPRIGSRFRANQSGGGLSSKLRGKIRSGMLMDLVGVSQHLIKHLQQSSNNRRSVLRSTSSGCLAVSSPILVTSNNRPSSSTWAKKMVDHLHHYIQQPAVSKPSEQVDIIMEDLLRPIVIRGNGDGYNDTCLPVLRPCSSFMDISELDTKLTAKDKHARSNKRVGLGFSISSMEAGEAGEAGFQEGIGADVRSGKNGRLWGLPQPPKSLRAQGMVEALLKDRSLLRRELQPSVKQRQLIGVHSLMKSKQGRAWLLNNISKYDFENFRGWEHAAEDKGQMLHVESFKLHADTPSERMQKHHELLKLSKKSPVCILEKAAYSEGGSPITQVRSSSSGSLQHVLSVTHVRPKSRSGAEMDARQSYGDEETSSAGLSLKQQRITLFLNSRNPDLKGLSRLSLPSPASYRQSAPGYALGSPHTHGTSKVPGAVQGDSQGLFPGNLGNYGKRPSSGLMQARSGLLRMAADPGSPEDLILKMQQMQQMQECKMGRDSTYTVSRPNTATSPRYKSHGRVESSRGIQLWGTASAHSQTAKASSQRMMGEAEESIPTRSRSIGRRMTDSGSQPGGALVSTMRDSGSQPGSALVPTMRIGLTAMYLTSAGRGRTR